MLESYLVRPSASAVFSHPLSLALDALVALRTAAAATLLVVLVGCASIPGAAPGTGAPSTTPTRPIDAEPPAPGVNLSGFPLPYRQGYADGCASAGGRETKDAARYSSDGNYRTGWIDGRAICTKK